MDLRDPKIWTDAFAVVVTAWPIIVPLVGLTSWVTWWIRGTMNKAVTDGLKATIDGMNATANNLRSQNDVLKERLLSAQEKRAEITEKVASLEAQLSAGAKPEVAVSNTIAAIASANNELSAILSGPIPYSGPVLSEDKATEDGASTL
jgi:hypothetical protein